MSFARLRALFERAQGLDRAAREALFAQENVDASLRAELDALLAVTDESRDTADPIAARIQRAAVEAVGHVGPERFGPYRILGTLGEGGMGTVLLGERADGEFEMKVAIKLIRGHASAQARERFRRERQLLAALDHPHIAALIDGGTTETGEPYLVMPYVEGETLPAWLERAAPRLTERLDLFVALCDAVAHAHQHLIVHRDLKPSNIMVRRDGVPVLLDFGIAKLLDPVAGEAETGSRVMTPAYASPEQLLGRPVTTATDVFGLGLILYELVAGTVPERGDVARASTVELPPPSKIAATAQLPAVRAEARRLRGDLDQIVRRAVRTDPAARYPSALALAADVQAWLAGRPVQAAGTHAWYVFSRFVRRHRYAAAALTLALAAAVAFAIGLARQRDRALAAEARATREAAVANETTGFLVDLFSELDPELHPGRSLSARELLDSGRERLAKLNTSVDVRARLERSLGWIYANAGEPTPAIDLLESARALDRDSGPADDRVRADTALSRVYYQIKRLPEALDAAKRAVALAESANPPDDAQIGRALLNRGVAEQSLAQFDAAAATFARAQTLFERAGATLELTSVIHNLGWLAEERGDDAASLAFYEDAYRRKLALLGPDHPKTLASLHGRSKALASLGRQAEAIAVLRELLERSIRVHGADTLVVENALNDLGSALQDFGAYDEAQSFYERALVVARKLEAETGGGLEANVVNNLATLLEDRGDLVAAERHYRRSREVRQQVFPAGHPSRAVPAHNLARLLIGLGRLDEAQVFAEEAHTLRSAALRPNHALTLNTEIVLAQLALARDDEAGALRWLTPIEAAIARDTTLPATLRAAAHELRARLAQRHGQTDAGIAEWRHVETDLLQMFPTAHPRMAQARLGLAEALLAAGDHAGATDLAQGAAPILRAQLVPQSPTLARLAALERALRAGR